MNTQKDNWEACPLHRHDNQHPHQNDNNKENEPTGSFPTVTTVSSSSSSSSSTTSISSNNSYNKNDNNMSSTLDNYQQSWEKVQTCKPSSQTILTQKYGHFGSEWAMIRM